MSSTYFVASLECLDCKKDSSVSEQTTIGSSLIAEPGIYYLRVGDKPNVGIGDMHSAYLSIQLPNPEAPIHILDMWECDQCGKADNWAEIVFDQGTIASIQSVELTQSALDRAHFISEEISGLFYELTGESIYQSRESPDDPRIEARSDFVRRLRPHLPV